MIRSGWIALVLLAGCEVVDGGNPFEPVAIAECECPECEVCDEANELSAEEGNGEDGSAEANAEANAETDGNEEDSKDPYAALFNEDETPDEPSDEPSEKSEGTGADAAMDWATTLDFQAGWGVRLITTVALENNPPQAYLGLPDGEKAWVQAGDLLAEPRLVVLAVGRDMVQLARITPAGDHATIQSETLSAMYPMSTRPASTPTP